MGDVQLHHLSKWLRGQDLVYDDEEMNFRVTKEDLESLRGDNLLFSSVIDTYLHFITLNDRHSAFVSSRYTRTIMDGQEIHEDPFVQILKSKSFEDLRVILFPINFDNAHWALCVAHVKSGEFAYYDSAGDLHMKALSAVWKLIRHLPITWSNSLNFAKETPKQKDGVSCGVFVCLFGKAFVDFYSHRDDKQASVKTLYRFKDLTPLDLQEARLSIFWRIVQMGGEFRLTDMDEHPVLKTKTEFRYGIRYREFAKEYATEFNRVKDMAKRRGETITKDDLDEHARLHLTKTGFVDQNGNMIVDVEDDDDYVPI